MSKGAEATAVAVSTDDFKTEIPALIDEAKAIQVKCDEDVVLCRDFLLTVKALKRKANGVFGPMKDKAYAAHKEICNQEKAVVGELHEAERVVKNKMGLYQEAQEAIREAKAKEQALRVKKAYDEALRRAEASVKKITGGAPDIEEKIKKLDNELYNPNITDLEEAAMRAEREVLQAKLENIAAKVEEKREAVEEMPVTYAPPIPKAPAPKVDGVSYRTKIEVKVTNPRLLLKAVVEGKVPPSVVKFDATAIKKLVTAGMKLPGVSVKRSKGVVVR